ncbi:MAG: toll/interleukin-1 receptor domain-containing protein, partial [Bacteroidetes bacterium]|nr:toll/interleukin-1 receptor domain-containing protein [Bacteroidota bacterium]
MSQNQVFISYSHQDEIWKDRLLPQLKALEQIGLLETWDDRRIDAGEAWYPEIQNAMKHAAATVLLVSADFLASDFITKEEVPFLLERREEEGMLLIPVLLSACPWKFIPWLKKLQMLPRDGKTVAEDFSDRYNTVFAAVAEQIGERFTDPKYRLPVPTPAWPPLLEAHLDIKRLPETGSALFGRAKELTLLDDAWESDATHIVSLVAYGGVGKSTLVNKWLEGLERDNYRGAERVFAWSFYSQGTKERVTSADLFIRKALEFFGDPTPDEGSPWDKGERLAKLVGQNRALLVLDGMEPLQSGQQVEHGKVKDPAL